MVEHLIHDVFGRVTEAESTARRQVLESIRHKAANEAYGDALALAYDRFDNFVTSSTPVSDAYAILTIAQRRQLRHDLENPALRVIRPDKTEWWIDANLSLLDRLEGGSFVGSVDEKQVKRQVGDKAF